MDDLKLLAAELKKHLPISTARKIVVRTCRMKHFGNTTLSDDERTITITINRGLSRKQQLDTLLHEWGHALQMDKLDWHGDDWGKHHAAAYRVYERLFC